MAKSVNKKKIEPFGSQVIDAIRRSFAKPQPSLQKLATELGIRPGAIQSWKKRTSVTPRQIALLVKKAQEAAKQKAHLTAVRPVVEFFPISKVRTKQDAAWEIFSQNGSDDSEHPYLEGLKSELQKLHGVYIFHDSRGQAIYVGQATKSLWKEMNLAFNRDRGELQLIRRVNHPVNKVQFRTSDEKTRQIVQREVQLCDLAYYCSAYVVDDSMINSVEALLVRSFANDLLNKKMEKFGEKQSKIKRAKK